MPEEGMLDKLTREYIQKNLRFRFKHFTSDNSERVVRDLESKIQAGTAEGLQPTINAK